MQSGFVGEPVGYGVGQAGAGVSSIGSAEAMRAKIAMRALRKKNFMFD